jgi:hypothetical protein
MAIIPNGQKISTSAPEVNTIYGGSASLKALNTWYTMEDISDTVRPYKVFTALLTQSGGDVPLAIYSGLLTIGVTYRIVDDGAFGWDFTNVGAPNNEIGTSFVATGTTPNSWGVNPDNYNVLDYNTGAPVVTVLENNIGNIWFAYVEAGGYRVVSDDLFVDNKTFINVTHLPIIDNVARFTFIKSDTSLIALVTVNDVNSRKNDFLLNTPIEIRVYN